MRRFMKDFILIVVFFLTISIIFSMGMATSGFNPRQFQSVSEESILVLELEGNYYGCRGVFKTFGEIP